MTVTTPESITAIDSGRGIYLSHNVPRPVKTPQNCGSYKRCNICFVLVVFRWDIFNRVHYCPGALGASPSRVNIRVWNSRLGSGGHHRPVRKAAKPPATRFKPVTVPLSTANQFTRPWTTHTQYYIIISYVVGNRASGPVVPNSASQRFVGRRSVVCGCVRGESIDRAAKLGRNYNIFLIRKKESYHVLSRKVWKPKQRSACK